MKLQTSHIVKYMVFLYERRGIKNVIGVVFRCYGNAFKYTPACNAGCLFFVVYHNED